MSVTTPEGAVKKKIKRVLDKYRNVIYVYMPVPGGFGKSSLDYLGCFYGKFFAIEAKRPGGKPTPRQWTMIAAIEAAGGKVFVIDGEDELAIFGQWLERVDAAGGDQAAQGVATKTTRQAVA
jgi:hypothetical protein